jgi:AraC-like DNA-binding protein
VAAMTNTGTLFQELAQTAEFIEFAALIRDLAGISVVLNTPDVGVSLIGVPGDLGNPICRLIRGSAEGARRCEACDRRQHQRAVDAGKARLYTCHAGFYDVAIPIFIQGEHVATISSGQVLRERHSDAAFARLQNRLEWLPVSPKHLRRAYDRAPWLPRKRLRQIMGMLKLFTRQMCESAWRMHKLEAVLAHPAITAGRAYADEHFRDFSLQLTQAAAAAGLSSAHFSHLFHKETGVTFSRYVQALRVKEAERLLTTTDRTVTDICFACGFNSLTHFNRVFRRGSGCCPSGYRQSRDARQTPGHP